MKRLALLAIVAGALAITPAALGAGTLSGKYRAKINGFAEGLSIKGTWVITFSNGTYRASDNGHPVVHGKYTIKGNKVTVKDAKGPNACPVKGVYKFKLSGKKLRFTEVFDSLSPACAGRVGVLSHTFTKIG